MTPVPADTQCTEANVAAICAALADYARPTPLRTALLAGRVHASTYYRWRARAEADEQPYADAVHRIEEARRDHLAHWTAEIALIAFAGTKEDATRLAALKFLIERLGGEAWNPAVKTEVSGPDGGPVRAEVVASVVVLPPLESADAEPNGAVAPEPGPTDDVPREPG